MPHLLTRHCCESDSLGLRTIFSIFEAISTLNIFGEEDLFKELRVKFKMFALKCWIFFRITHTFVAERCSMLSSSLRSDTDRFQKGVW